MDADLLRKVAGANGMLQPSRVKFWFVLGMQHAELGELDREFFSESRGFMNMLLSGKEKPEGPLAEVDVETVAQSPIWDDFEDYMPSFAWAADNLDADLSHPEGLPQGVVTLKRVQSLVKKLGDEQGFLRHGPRLQAFQKALWRMQGLSDGEDIPEDRATVLLEEALGVELPEDCAGLAATVLGSGGVDALAWLHSRARQTDAEDKEFCALEELEAAAMAPEEASEETAKLAAASQQARRDRLEKIFQDLAEDGMVKQSVEGPESKYSKAHVWIVALLGYQWEVERRKIQPGEMLMRSEEVNCEELATILGGKDDADVATVMQGEWVRNYDPRSTKRLVDMDRAAADVAKIERINRQMALGL